MPRAEGPIHRNSFYVTVRSESPNVLHAARASQGFIQVLRGELGPHAVASPQEWTQVSRISDPGAGDRFSVEATVMVQVAVQPFTEVEREGARDDRLDDLRAHDLRPWATDVLEYVTQQAFSALRRAGLAATAGTVVTSVTEAPDHLMSARDPERIWSRQLRLTPEMSRQESFEVRWSVEPAAPEVDSGAGRTDPATKPRTRLGFKPPQDSQTPAIEPAEGARTPRVIEGEVFAAPSGPQRADRSVPAALHAPRRAGAEVPSPRRNGEADRSGQARGRVAHQG